MMFRYELATGLFFRKHYGSPDEGEVPYDNRMLTDAMLYGDEIDAETYQAGKPRT